MTDFEAHKMPQSDQAADPSSYKKDIDGIKSAHLAAGSNPINGQEMNSATPETNGVKESPQNTHKVSTSEEKTGNDLSKQPTQVEASLAGKHIVDDSSSSSDDDDDSDDYPLTKAPPPVAKKEEDNLQTPVKSNPEQVLNQTKPSEQLIAQSNQTQNQQIELQKDLLFDKKEQPNNELQAQQATDAEGEKSSLTVKPAEAEIHNKEAITESKDEKDAKFQSDEKMAQSQQKVDGNDEQADDKQLKIPSHDALLVNQNDTIMNDESIRPLGEINNNSESVAQPEDQQARQLESQMNSINQPDKELINRKILHSQSLWGAGNINKDVDMDDDDFELDEMDPEFKQECINAQDNDKLFTLNINTYQVCKLNIILSSFGLKLDPKEQVQTQIRKKEAEDRRRRKKQHQLQRKEEQQQKIRPQYNQEVSAHAMTLVAGSQANARYIKGQPVEEAQSAQLFKKEANGHIKQDGSIANDPQSMSSYSAKEQKAGAAESQVNTAGDKPVDAIDDLNGAKETPVQAALTGMTADQKASINQLEANESDLRALSPTPRKSERERPPVSYEKMINGNGRRSDTDDEVDTAVADSSHLGGAPGQFNNQKHKKPQDQQHNQAKKQSTEDANKRIRDFFDKLSQHQFSGLMNQPLSKHNPLWEQYKNDWKALAMIDAMHRCGKYTNSKEIISDINNLILTKFSMLSATGDSDDIINVQAFQKYFDSISQGLDNLNLSNKNRPIKPEEPIKNEPIKENKKKKPKPAPHNNNNKGPPDVVKDSIVDMNQGIEIKTVKAITQEEIAELKKDIMSLQNDQRAEIENVAPECITTNANGGKQLELSNLKAHPEIAAKLIQFVKKMTKKNQQREIRRKKDAARRLKKQQEKGLNNGQAFNQTDASKPGVNVHPLTSNMGGQQVAQGQDLMAAQNLTAANMHQASFPQNAAQMAQFQPGFNYKPGFPAQAAPNQQQQQFLNQIQMNLMLQQQGLNPANLQQLMSNPATLQQMMYQMQQQPGNNGQAQAAAAALQKQGGMPGQVAGMPQAANDGSTAAADATQKKGVANRAAQDDGSSSQSSSSDSDSS